MKTVRCLLLLMLAGTFSLASAQITKEQKIWKEKSLICNIFQQRIEALNGGSRHICHANH